MSEGVALYVRVSTADQDLAGQQRDLQRYAESKGWGVVAVYSEKTSASGRVVRKAHEQLLVDAADARSGWRRVLVWALDRWSREPSFVKAVGSIEQLEELGVRFHSYREPSLDSSEDGRPSLERDVLRAILPAVASFESRRRADRTIVAMREIKEGRRPTRSGRRPGRPSVVTPQKVTAAIRLRKQEKSWAEVAQHVGLKVETIRKAVWQAQRAPVGRPGAPGPSDAQGGRGIPRSWEKVGASTGAPGPG
ncbi:MAG: recombinase family protein [Thermoplasmata archaeon]|nr:recombinase family protein [Thermoplasmata archaeon]